MNTTDQDAPAVYVRSSTRAIYKNPILIVNGGMVLFTPADEVPLFAPPASGVWGIAVAWDHAEATREHEDVIAEAIQCDVEDARKMMANFIGWQDVQVPPATDPPRMHRAALFTFDLARPIPQPTHGDRYGMYAKRLRGELLLDPKPYLRGAG